MASEVKLPPLGESVTSGDVVDVKVKVGDTVKTGQCLLEVEAEKSTAEVPAPSDGKVTQIMVKKGDRVVTGQVILMLDAIGVAVAPTSPAPAKPAETPKPAVQPAAAVAPVVKPAVATVAAPLATAVAAGPGEIVPAGPATRAMAREWGVPIETVPATGPYGRVTQEDVKGHIRALANGSAAAAAGPVKTPPLPDFSKWGPTETKPVEGIRKRTAEHMALCWSVIPHVTQSDLADITDIEAFRKQQEGKGPKLTVTAFVLKAISILLKQFPNFNSSLDWETRQLILKQYYHIGVAVDTDRGLVVPVLRDVDKKSVHEIGKEMTETAERARQNKLTADDMKGGSFTISNLGGIGGTAFTPIVNWPEVAILGLSRARMQPVWRDGEFKPRLLMPISLSYDHRVIDGADAARFARRLADLLENPMVMLLHA